MTHSKTWFTCYHPQPEAQWRLFCFPHGGGGPQTYRAWAEGLPDTIELLTLTLPGRGPRLNDPLISSMADLTPRLVEGMQPYFDKPFAIFGHSVGGLLSFETTRYLQQNQLPLPLHLFVSAHHAPHQTETQQSMHNLPDAELITLLRDLGLVPDEALANPELLSLILPPLRADFALSETYQFVEADPLPVPFTMLGGQTDDLVSEADLAAWQPYTTASFESKLFPAGHFYTESHQAELLETLVQRVEADIAVLPPSIMEGEDAPYPADSCLHELFRQQAAATPHRVAVVDGTRQLTFAELDAQTDLLAQYLQQQGVEVDSLVGIYMETSLEYLLAYLAILKAGGAYMPLETAYPEALLSKALDASQPALILSNETFLSNLPDEWHSHTFSMTPAWPDQLAALNLPPLNEGDRPQPTPDSLAYCVMSSGTTGTPKGIICPHRGAVNSYHWRYHHYPYQEGEREANNVFFVWEAIRPLLQGYPTYIIPDEVIYDPPQLVNYLYQHEITRILFTPSLFDQILNTPNLDLAEKFKHLRIIYLNGEVVTTALRNESLRRFPHITLLNDYSISECHDVCTYDLAEVDPNLSPKYAPLGTPMSNVRLYLLDEQQQPVPHGFRGEIYVGGDSLARGYLNAPAKTAERFVPDPLREDGSRMFRTGDVGRLLPNGQLEIQGRIAFMVKLRGYSIVPSAVETAIIEHPAVSNVAVITKNNKETGQPEHLVAYMVGNGQLDDSALVEALRPYLKEQLPHYAVPSYLIPLPELPLAATGKLDRRRLPKPDDIHLTAQHGPPPTTELEQHLAVLWQDLLGVEQVSATDNFFDLGGHSLWAAKLCSQIRTQLGLEVSVIDLFQHPTVRTLAEQFQPALADESALDSLLQTKPFQSLDSTDIAIVGVACRFPDAPDADSFWQNLRNGHCSVRPFTDEELAAQGVPPEVYQREGYMKVGAILEDVDKFDPKFWGLSYKEATLMDPQQRLFLECCWQALEHAGYAPQQQGQRTGVFAGSFLPSYLLHFLHGGGLMDPGDPMEAHLTELGNDKDYLATRVAYLLNLRGPSVSVQTSCSTALVAVATASQSLLTGQCDTAIAGASSLTFPQGGYQYAEGHIGSVDGVCRPFDAEASGTLFGDGVGAVILKRLADAQRDGDNIMAVIKGFAINNDGALKAGYSAPSVQGQAEVIAQAQAMAGVSPESISYIEAHGTGTLIGDPIEVRALTEVFRRTTERTGFCAIGSVKPNIGHSNIAAGMAGLIKTIMALQQGEIPPTLHYKSPNPAMNLEQSPFYVADQLQPWTPPESQPRRAGVSCFGIGGTNCHMILEEAVSEPLTPPETASPQIFTLSAKSPYSLDQARQKMAAYLQNQPDLPPTAVAYTLHVGREQFPYRMAVVGESLEQAANRLNTAPLPAHAAPADPQIVFMFPGQGSQYLQMGQQLYQTVPQFQHYVDACCDIVEPWLEVDLRPIMFGSAEQEATFKLAYHLQPALFTVEYALARTLIDWGIQPTALVGHSIGEYTAACIAGMLSLEDALLLVVRRGQAMEAAEAGAMLSVRMTETEAHAFVAESDQPVSVAVINSPTDMVLSGPVAAIEQVEQQLVEARQVCRRVHVTRAFHSAMMEQAAARLTEQVKQVTLKPPTIPLASNLTGDWLTPEQAQDPTYWGQHMRHAVRFADNLALILEQQPDILLEVGPGRTLSKLVSKVRQQVAPDATPTVLPTMRHPLETKTKDDQFLSKAIAQLWQNGPPLDWAAFYDEATASHYRRVPLPGYRFEPERCWPDTTAQNRLNGTPTTQIATTKSPLDEWFYAPSWTRQHLLAGPLADEEKPRCWLLFMQADESQGAQLAEEIATMLTAQGHEVVRAYRTVGPKNGHQGYYLPAQPEAEDYRELFRKLTAADTQPDCMLHLWSLDCSDTAAFEHLLALSQALINHNRPLDLWVVTTETVQVNQEPLNPLKATMFGPCTVLPQENPQVSCRVVDLQLSQPLKLLARQLVAESATATPEALIALRGAYRWLPRYEPLPLTSAFNQPGEQQLPAEGCYIITGGLGRIGLTLAEHLARRQAKLVLTTRRAVPSVQTEQLRYLEELGASVTVLQTEMSDPASVQQMVTQTLDQFGEITGIFHAAGVADLRYLPEMTAPVVQQEFAPKLAGLSHLAAAIGDLSSHQRPEFVMTFSSIASLLGGFGMVAYTAANRFMDAFVQAEPYRHGVTWLNVNWDDWDFEYGKEQVAAYEKTQAQFAMAPAEGLEALTRIVGQASAGQIMLSTRPLAERLTKWLAQHAAEADDAGSDEADTVAASPTSLEAQIAVVYQEVLGVPQLSPDDNFFDLGGDSLLATQILLKLQRHLPAETEISLRAIFDYPTVRELVQHSKLEPVV